MYSEPSACRLQPNAELTLKDKTSCSITSRTCGPSLYPKRMQSRSRHLCSFHVMQKALLGSHLWPTCNCSSASDRCCSTCTRMLALIWSTAVCVLLCTSSTRLRSAAKSACRIAMVDSYDSCCAACFWWQLLSSACSACGVQKQTGAHKATKACCHGQHTLWVAGRRQR